MAERNQMTVYVMGEVTLKNAGWVEAYLAEINDFIEKHGGRVLSRSLNMEKLEGNRPLPTNVILIEYPTREAALGFLNDPDYQPLGQARREGSQSEFLMFPAEDFAAEAG